MFTEIPTNANLYGGRDEQWWRSIFNEFETYRPTWEQLRDDVEKRLEGAPIEGGVQTDRLKRLFLFANQQVQEAETLANKLRQYAVQHAVPMHWRRRLR